MAHGEVLIHAEVLELNSDAEMGALEDMQSRDIVVAEADDAAICANAPYDELEQRALPCAIRADDAAKLPFAERQV